MKVWERQCSCAALVQFKETCAVLVVPLVVLVVLGNMCAGVTIIRTRDRDRPFSPEALVLISRLQCSA